MGNNKYPAAFKRQHKGVKYETDGYGNFIFNKEARMKDIHDIRMGVNKKRTTKVTKAQAIKWAKEQIEAHPKWIKEAADPRNK